MNISQEIINEIREKVNIVDVISEYISIEQRGKNHFAVCPFHDDHNPSMSISSEKQIYTCFVCGAHGNVFSFVKDYENVSFVESVRIVGSKVGIDIKTQNFNKKNNINENDKVFYEIYDISNKFYQNLLNTNDGIKAKEYLKARKIDENLIKEFEIGLSTSNKLYKLLSEKKYKNEDLIDSGISSKNENNFYDTFTNRIMFPLYDLDGKTVGFSGRSYLNNDSSKYINSKESRIFKKGKLLYNYHRAKDEIRRKKFLILVEGFMDVIAMHKVGIKNVVATMGTAVTADQATLIKRLSNNVILLFDGDEAGNKATVACSNELLKSNIIPNVVRLPNNLDPDDFIEKNGLEKFNEYLNNPLSYLDYKIAYYKQNTNFNNSDDVSNYIKNVINEIKNEKDDIIKEITLKNLSDDTNVSVVTLKNLIKNERKIIIEYNKPKEKIKILNKFEKAERRIVFYMLRHEEVIKIFDRNKCFLPTQDLRFLANEIIYFYKKYNGIKIADFISYLNDKEELLKVLKEINQMQISENYLREEIMDYINLLDSYGVEIEIKRLTNLFKSETNDEKKAEIAKEISNLKVRV